MPFCCCMQKKGHDSPHISEANATVRFLSSSMTYHSIQRNRDFQAPQAEWRKSLSSNHFLCTSQAPRCWCGSGLAHPCLAKLECTLWQRDDTGPWVQENRWHAGADNGEACPAVGHVKCRSRLHASLNLRRYWEVSTCSSEWGVPADGSPDF